MCLWDSSSENKESEQKSKLISKTQILGMIIKVLNIMLTGRTTNEAEIFQTYKNSPKIDCWAKQGGYKCVRLLVK